MSLQQFINSKLSSRWKASCIYMFSWVDLWCITSAVVSTKTILPVANKGIETPIHIEPDRESWCRQAGGRPSDASDAEEVGGEGKRRIWVGGGWRKGKKQAEDESWCTATPIKNDSRWKTRQRNGRDYGGRWERRKEAVEFQNAGAGGVDVRDEQCKADRIRRFGA